MNCGKLWGAARCGSTSAAWAACGRPSSRVARHQRWVANEEECAPDHAEERRVPIKRGFLLGEVRAVNVRQVKGKGPGLGLKGRDVIAQGKAQRRPG